MRIVHGLHWSQGGIVKFLELLLSDTSLSKEEHYVIILNSETEASRKLSNYCQACYSLGWENNKIGALIRLNDLIKELKPDIFHAHSFLPGLLGRILSPNKTVCMATIHNEYPHYKDNALRSRVKLFMEYQSLKRSCQSVVCVSDTVRQLVDLAMPRLPSETVNNGVPISMAKDSLKRQKNDSLTILSLGRLDSQKGYDVLLTAFGILHKQGVDAHLRIVGEGSLRPILEGQVQDLDITGKVCMPGFTDNPVKEFENADIFVCSSRYEGLSIATAEAMSFGLPLITTLVGGVASMVSDGVEAKIVPVDDAAELARAIIELIKKPDLRYNIGEKGRDFAREHFNILNTAHDYKTIYAKLLQK